MSTDIFIKKAWIYFIKLTRKIVVTQKNMSDLFKSERRF